MIATLDYFFVEVIILFVDIGCLVIALAGAGIGAYKGVFRMASRLIAAIIAVVLAINLSGVAAEFVYVHFFEPSVTDAITSKVEEMGAEEAVVDLFTSFAGVQKSLSDSGIIDNANVDSVLSDVSNAFSAADIDIESMLPSELTEGYAQLSDWLSGIGSFIGDKVDLAEFAGIVTEVKTKGVTNGFTSPTEDKLSPEKVVSEVVGTFKTPIMSFISPICFSMIYILSYIILALVLNFVAGLLEKLKITRGLSTGLGAGIGLVCGVGIALVAAFLISIIITPKMDLYAHISNSFMLNTTQSLTSMILK